MTKKLTYETVYDEIKRKIESGIWKPGQQIPPLEQLSVELGVGISSIREAVRILGQQKILRVEQGRGTYVENDVTGSDGERTLDFLEKATMLQLTEARLIIEPELAAIAAEKATEAEAEAIMRTADTMRRKIRKKQNFFKEDLLFHELIARASHNEVMFHMLERISDLLTDSRRRSMKWEGMDKKAASYHHLIAQAIVQCNPTQARTLMKSHMEDMLLGFRQNI
ncbi:MULTISPECIES: FCD domain-containing protein [unclassified Paenibacillus]|uniref:FadR/GntR family transcriptional regulator n=1 Tax=unclassified Paenibacillus TaxID=185978 RepID=UPI001AE471DF|nr:MULTISPECIES: FCD domain-containing protein [unclassified Paenibacillus]MBP1153889.1 GntR family transcriptional repressor for pyruvate dehydrogenase complex [Paenibacillus sp. PvP091]MBP1170726.1 GntR family transcriptional repressor for pyruvate dehydrogenase complex [Paenibacillus sp. PvR098]MBP2441754.1 GntR family transcriptional repressor for pyruvate dehydrogenase complex [Paenibacillus sp. PvP052]